MILEEEKTQLERYVDNLPTKPYCSNTLDFGLLIRAKKTAVKHRHIQHNKHTSVAYIVLDIDHPYVFLKYQEQVLPQPNLIIINPENHHAHLFYELKTPIHKTEFARQKPLRYLASIEYALREVWEADTAYSGLISKNPLHSDWETHCLRSDPWELGELADWLTLPSKLPRQAQDVGLGRNCTLFDMLRFWAYENVLSYRITGGGYNQWFKAVLSASESFNSFPVPLGINEVTNTAKSVSKWVWTNYTKRMSDQQFSERQAERGRQGGKKGGRGRTTIDAEKRSEALKMRSEGHTIRAISEALHLPYSTIGRWCKGKKSQ